MAVSSSDSTRTLAVPSPTHPGFRGGVLPQLQGELDGEPPHHNAGLGMEYPVSTDTMRHGADEGIPLISEKGCSHQSPRIILKL
jgi:hypothetical protein